MQNLKCNGRANPADDGWLRIPMDLTEWVPAEELMKWINMEVETLDWANPELETWLQIHPDYQPKQMLRLLTYAYLTGMFESDEIVSACRTNVNLRVLSESYFPNSKAIGRFRKENRALLKWALVQVLKRALQGRLGSGEGRVPAGLRQALVDSAVERLDLARHMDRAAQGA